MGVLYFPQLTNFVEYDTDSDMQESELIDIVPGAVVYSKESQKAYQFMNSLTDISSDSLTSDTGEGYWVPIRGEYIYENNGAISSSNITEINLTEGEIFIGNTSNIATSYQITGSLNLTSEGVATINLSYGQVFIGDSDGLSSQHIITGVLSLQNNGVTSLRLNEGQIFIGSNANFASTVTPTGPVTINNTGTTSISNNAITYDMLSTDINYSSRIFTSFRYSTSGGATTYSILTDGILQTDYPSTQIGFITNTSAILISCYLEDGSFNFEFDTAPGIFVIYCYVYRNVVT